VHDIMPARANEECWLITQDDHAKLAGDIAARLATPPEPAAVRAIAVHDAGWVLLDQIPPQDEPPVSFFYVAPRDAVQAWRGSIEGAARGSALGGLMVSGHFLRLAADRLRSGADAAEDAAALRSFLDHEPARQERLRRTERRQPEAIERLVDLLQFCDLVSLYLCCGTDAPAEFPQLESRGGMMIRKANEGFALEPSPFRAPVTLSVSAYRYEPRGRLRGEELSFRVR
jgi:hypothetical protein